jgi:hypothetical protein
MGHHRNGIAMRLKQPFVQFATIASLLFLVGCARVKDDPIVMGATFLIAALK